MQITKTETPAKAAEKSQPCINALPLTGRLADRTERLSQFLQHKRICHVLNDTSFEKSFGRHVAIDYAHMSKFKIDPGEPINPLLLDCSMTITDMSVFLRMLSAEQATEDKPKAPSLIKDMILIDSPVLLEKGAFDRLEAGLAAFRSMHPHAAIVVGKPIDENALLQMDLLRGKGLVDNLVTKTHKTSAQLLFRGAVILQAKLAKLAAAVKEGIAACDPADIHETLTVLTEPLQ